MSEDRITTLVRLEKFSASNYILVTFVEVKYLPQSSWLQNGDVLCFL
jgi:hypothetical protein